MRKQWIPGSPFAPAPALVPGDEAGDVAIVARFTTCIHSEGRQTEASVLSCNNNSLHGLKELRVYSCTNVFVCSSSNETT